MILSLVFILFVVFLNRWFLLPLKVLSQYLEQFISHKQLVFDESLKDKTNSFWYLKIKGFVTDLSNYGDVLESLYISNLYDKKTSLKNKSKFYQDTMVMFLEDLSGDDDKVAEKRFNYVFWSFELNNYESLIEKYSLKILEEIKYKLIQKILLFKTSYMLKKLDVYFIDHNRFYFLGIINSEIREEIFISNLNAYVDTIVLSKGYNFISLKSIKGFKFLDRLSLLEYNKLFNGDIKKIIEKIESEMQVSLEHARHNHLPQVIYNIDVFIANSEKELKDKLIKNAIAKKSFDLQFQQYIGLHDGKLKGLEVFLRWKNGDISTRSIFDYAEKEGCKEDLDEIVFYQLRENIELLNNYVKDNLEPIYISINVSTNYFLTESFLSNIRYLSKEINQEKIILAVEMNEDNRNKFYELMSHMVEIIKKYNVKIILDDFGNNYYNINFLLNFPVDCIKLSVSRSRLICEDKKEQEKYLSLKSAIEYSKAKVVFLGLKEQEELEVLKDLGVDMIQSYAFSKLLEWKDIKNNVC